MAAKLNMAAKSNMAAKILIVGKLSGCQNILNKEFLIV